MADFVFHTVLMGAGVKHPYAPLENLKSVASSRMIVDPVSMKRLGSRLLSNLSVSAENS